MSDYETIIYEVDDTAATITMNRPDRLNGIVNTMMRELYDCLNQVARDDSIRVVQLTGAGKGFCPGADLKANTGGEPQEPNKSEYFHISTLLHEMPKITVAAINGACAGAGFGWACACDLRYAATSASIRHSSASRFLVIWVPLDAAANHWRTKGARTLLHAGQIFRRRSQADGLGGAYV